MRMSSCLWRLAFYAATWLAVTVIAIVGVALLLVALWFLLSQTESPALAALWTGLAALGAAALIAAVACGVRRRRPRAGGLAASLMESAGTGRRNEAAAELGALLGREAAALISAHPARSAIAAVAVGFVVGVSPRLREVLREILK